MIVEPEVDECVPLLVSGEGYPPVPDLPQSKSFGRFEAILEFGSTYYFG